MLITRTAIFSTLGSYLYAFSQEQTPLTLPLNSSLEHPILSYLQGSEYSPKPDRHLKNHQLTLRLPWKKPLITHPYFTLYGATEWSLNHWHSTQHRSQNPEGLILSLTPMFRYTTPTTPHNTLHPYLEMGIGVAMMDESIVENRDKSSLFQFTDSIGFGVMKREWSLGYRFTHISNLNIKSPNPSIDLHQIMVSYRF